MKKLFLIILLILVAFGSIDAQVGRKKGKVGTKQVDESTIGNNKILYYDSTANKVKYMTAPTISGLGSMAYADSTTYQGNANLIKLGTVITGIWNGSVIGDAYITKTGIWTGAVTSTGTVSGTTIALSGTDINTAGTLTNVVYNNAWGTPKGGMLFDGVDDKFDLANYSDIQEIQLYVNLESVTSVALGTLGTNLTIDITSGVVTLGSGFLNSTIYVNNTPTSAISTGKNFIVIQFNAVSISGGSLGYDGTSYGKFDLYLFREFNTQTSTSELTDAYNNRRPDLAEVPYKYVGGSQTELWDAAASVFTSGTYSWVVYSSNTIANVGNALEITYVNADNGAYVSFKDASDMNTDLIVGKKYRLTVDAKYTGGSAGSGLAIGSVGSPFATLTTSMVTYTTEFVAVSATTDNLRGNGMSASNVVTIDNLSIIQIGAVAEYKEFGSFGVVDSSPNRLNGNTSGSPISLVKGNEVEYVDYKGQVTGATTLTDIAPKGYKIESILFENTTANAVTGGIKIGTTVGGTDVVSAATVGANAEGLMTLAKDFFSTSANQTLYIDAVTAWNAASINLTFRFRKVK